ncbi:MAG TPA: SH3 domain-containing protein [Waterburya sp.]|jgi:hypothetical protein
MNKLGHWSKPVAIVALTLTAVGELNAAVTALPSTPTTKVTQKSQWNSPGGQDNYQLAQGLVGQCRAAKQRIFVYPERSTSSQSIRTLAENDGVILADTGVNGWIAISAPVAGYVQARDLTLCNSSTKRPTPAPTPTPTPAPTPSPTPTPTPTPTSSANSCRKVIYPPEGLAVRNTPVLSAPRIGGVYVGNTVKLANPRQSEKDSQGRTWVKISQPTSGWISSGFPNGNLGPEFPCP